MSSTMRHPLQETAAALSTCPLPPHQYPVPTHMEAVVCDPVLPKTPSITWSISGTGEPLLLALLRPIPTMPHSDVTIHSASPRSCFFNCTVSTIYDVLSEVLCELTPGLWLLAHPDSWHTPTWA